MSGKDSQNIINAEGHNGYAKQADNGMVYPAAGNSVKLGNTPVYSFSSAPKPSLYANGTYKIYDGRLKNGRYRITDKAYKVGKKPALFFVTGWVDGSAVKI